MTYSTNGSVLAFKDVTQTFGEHAQKVTVLAHTSISFLQGQTYALTGISGTGKSTVLQLLAGFITPTVGLVTYNDRSLGALSPAEYAVFLQNTIGFVFQSALLLDELSVRENVMLKGLLSRQLSAAALKQRADYLLHCVGLTHKADEQPQVLSGGEQQRVSIARALCLSPEFVLADEPTAHLDEQSKMRTMSLINDLQKELGFGLIIASHDPQIAHMMQTHMIINDETIIRKER